MAEKAIRLGGESTADAIVSAVDSLYPEHTFEDKEFALKHNDDEIAVDTNFAAQNFWKEALIRFFNKKSAVLGLILIVVIVLLAVFGPGMNRPGAENGPQANERRRGDCFTSGRLSWWRAGMTKTRCPRWWIP